jgi:hypothetical protein
MADCVEIPWCRLCYQLSVSISQNLSGHLISLLETNEEELSVHFQINESDTRT